MPTREDRLTQLLLRLGGGDPAAMQELFLQERAGLHRLFLGLSRRVGLADDLVQETFLALWRYRTNFQGSGSAAGYLYRVAVHQWRRGLSKERRRRSMQKELNEEIDEPGTASDASSPLESGEALRAIRAAVEALPDAQREVFLLHRWHGLSCPEIAEATETNLKTVESRLRLALKKLTSRLEPLKEPR